MSRMAAINEIKKCATTQFNPELVALIENDGFADISYNVNEVFVADAIN